MFESIIPHFALSGTFLKAERFGSGLINDTYLCEFQEDETVRKYILQRINSAIFTHPEQVMENVEAVTTHIIKRLRGEGFADPFTVTPALIHTREGRSFHRDGAGSYWRMFHFIESGAVFDTVRDAKHAREVGRGLGRFQSLVSDLPPGSLHDTLPGFHHTPLYLKQFDDALGADVKQRSPGIKTEAAFVSRRQDLAPVLTRLLDANELPLRVVHNDPKVNNIMIHKESGRRCACSISTR